MKIIKQLHGGGSSAGIFLIEDEKGREVVMKFADWSGVGSNGIPWLKAQYKRLKELKESLDPTGASRIPTVYDYSETSRDACYTLEYLPQGTPLSTYHLEHPENKEKDFLNDLDQLVTLMADELYSQGRLEIPPGYIERVHLSRLKYRLGLLYKTTGEVYEKLLANREYELSDQKTCKLTDLFQDMWDSDFIFLNNKQYLNTRHLVDKLEYEPGRLDNIMPSFLPRFAHGDALLRNFMKMPNGKVMIFDVRGVDLPDNSPARIDIPYELGKMLHGILLEIVRNDLFELKIKREDKKVSFELHYDVNHLGVSKFLNVRDQMPMLFKNNKSLQEALKDEPNWLSKSLFTEATHFLADAVNRLENDPSGRHAVAYYLIGTQLLNEYFNSTTLN